MNNQIILGPEMLVFPSFFSFWSTPKEIKHLLDFTYVSIFKQEVFDGIRLATYNGPFGILYALSDRRNSVAYIYFCFLFLFFFLGF